MTSSLPLNDPSQWPVRMTRAEVAHVSRRSISTLFNWIRSGRFPQADGDGMWSRSTVQRYLEGGIQKYDERHEREQRRSVLKAVTA